MTINLHIHSNFSDGKNSISQIVKEALLNDLEIIAITDHSTNSWKSQIIPSLNSNEKIKKYLSLIRAEQKVILARDLDLIILKGIEIDIGSSKSFIEGLVNPLDFDIILFEYLETEEGLNFCKELIDKWRKGNIQKDFPILGLAHFDPSFFLYSDLDLLIDFLKKYGIFLEFNTRYSEFFSLKYQSFFQEIKKHNILISMGSDAHELHQLMDLESATEIIECYGLAGNLRNLIGVI
ncbi:MAG: PHP domain-containing protein, partial [Candidatus Lokiarchaeota archaeon]